MPFHKNVLRSNFLNIIGVISFSFLFISCGAKKIEGIGEVVAKTHRLENFEAVNLSNGWKGILMKGETNKMVVTANKNLHGALQYHVKGNTLFILSDQKIGKADDKTILIYHTDEISNIQVMNGAGLVANSLDVKKMEVFSGKQASVSLHVNVKELSLQATDDATIRVSGATNHVSAIAKNDGSIHAKNLIAKSANVTAANDGTIIVTANQKIIAESAKGGLIEYYGEPGTVNIQKGPESKIIKK